MCTTKTQQVSVCAQTGHGLSFSTLHDGHNGMATAMVIMAAEWPVLLTLSWYFGQVLPSGAHPPRRALRCCCVLQCWGEQG